MHDVMGCCCTAILVQGELLSAAEIKDITAEVLNPKPVAVEAPKEAQRVSGHPVALSICYLAEHNCWSCCPCILGANALHVRFEAHVWPQGQAGPGRLWLIRVTRSVDVKCFVGWLSFP